MLFAYAIVGAFMVTKIENAFLYPVLSEISILIFLSPIFYSLYKIYGLKKAFLTIFIFSTLGLLIEFSALKTGLPYGYFNYGETAVFKIADILPWTVGMSWAIFVLGAIGLNSFIKNKSFVYKIFLTGFYLVLFDLVLDPGAVSINMWSYVKEGFWFGVPFQNFVGWFITGILASIIGIGLLKRENQSLFFAFLPMNLFWTTICFINNLFIPFAIGLFILILGVLKYESEKTN